MRYETDRKEMFPPDARKLEGTPRFALSLNDDQLSGPSLIEGLPLRDRR